MSRKRSYRRSSYRRSFRRNKLTLGSFCMYWLLPVLGVVIPVAICLAHKGYISIAK